MPVQQHQQPAHEAAELLRVLIIDDDEVDQMALKRSVRKSGLQAEVFTASTATEGLALLQQNTFDCIFTDFRLPDMDGLELVERLQQLELQAPVLLVSSQGDERVAAQAIRLGAADYIPKSLLTPETIAHSIRTAIRLRKAELERIYSEQRLRSTQYQLDLIIANSPMAFFSVNAAGEFLFAQGMVWELMDLNPEELIGQPYHEALKPYPRIVGRFRRALSGETIQSMDESNGRFFKAHYVPVQDAQGKLMGVTGFAIDVTDRIQNERELTQAKEIAERSVKVKEQFLANISHEIRTPMNGIIGLTNVLQKTELGLEQQKFLKAIQTSASNLMLIINDLLDFSKITSQQFTFEQIEFDLQELVQDIVDLMEPRATEQGNKLSTYTDVRVPLQLVGDPLRLKQVLLNLIGNAIKFTDKGEIKLLTHLTTQEEDTVMLEFTVEDTGIGIPADKLQDIFESFNQGSNHTSRKYGGTGLGLTISKKLVEMQGGTIAVRSQPALGSAFTFSLPFTLKPEPEAQTADEVAATAEDKLGELGKLRILLAEDNEINQLLITTVLYDWNLETDAVMNGLEALNLFAQQEYDLILMDMQMPEMDGYDAIKEIRQLEGAKAQVPIIALTAHATTGEVEKCLAAGADAYVSKPFDPDLLYQTIYRLTSKSVAVPASASATIDLAPLYNLVDQQDALTVELLHLCQANSMAAAEQLKQQASENNLSGLILTVDDLIDSVSVVTAQPLLNSLSQLQEALKKKNILLIRQLADTIYAETLDLKNLLEKELQRQQI